MAGTEFNTSSEAVRPPPPGCVNLSVPQHVDMFATQRSNARVCSCVGPSVRALLVCLVRRSTYVALLHPFDFTIHHFGIMSSITWFEFDIIIISNFCFITMATPQTPPFVSPSTSPPPQLINTGSAYTYAHCCQRNNIRCPVMSFLRGRCPGPFWAALQHPLEPREEAQCP